MPSAAIRSQGIRSQGIRSRAIRSSQGIRPAMASKYGYVPQGPPPPAAAEAGGAAVVAPVRSFELVMRRLSFQGRSPSPGPSRIEVRAGVDLGRPTRASTRRASGSPANAVFYLSGQPFRGLWPKAHFAYENFTATYTNPYDTTLCERAEAVQLRHPRRHVRRHFVVPRSGGFALSAASGSAWPRRGRRRSRRRRPAARNIPGVDTTLYEGFDKVRILGTLGLGIAF